MKRASDVTKIVLQILLCLLITHPALAKKSHVQRPTKTPPQVQTQTTHLVFSFDEKAELTSLAINNLEKLKQLIPNKTFQCVSQLAQSINAIDQQKFESARQTLQNYSCGELASYRAYYLALALGHLGRYSEALTHIPLPTSIQKKIDVDQFWLRAKILAFKGDVTQLATEIAWFNKFKKFDPLTSVKSDYSLGLAQYLAGQKKTALSCFYKVYVTNAGTEFDNKVLLILQAKGDSTKSFMNDASWLKRAQNLRVVGQTDEAVNILEQLAQKNRAVYETDLAEALFDARDYAKAAELFEQLLKTNKASEVRVDLLVKISQAYARSNNFDKAIDANIALLTQFPKSQEALDAPFKIAYLTFDAGLFDDAIKKFEPFLTDKNKHRQILAVRYRAWAFYLTNRFKEALVEWDILQKQTTNHQLSTTYFYWMARASEKLNDKKAAASYYRLAAEADSNSYYGLLAKQRMTFGKLEPQSLIKPSWMQRGPDVAGDVTSFAHVPTTDSLYNAILLAQLGLDVSAFDEASRSALTKTVDAATLNLAHYYVGQDYPLAYVDFINYSATAHNTEQALMWAIMRQESRFKPAIQSNALALGLMQFIPSTSHQIAAELNLPNFSTARLTEPSLNIYFGAYYLTQLKAQMNQSLIPTIAAYNAGPKAVQNWLTQRGHLEMDEWVELIPYKETREYVKKVLENYLVYSQK